MDLKKNLETLKEFINDPKIDGQERDKLLRQHDIWLNCQRILKLMTDGVRIRIIHIYIMILVFYSQQLFAF